MKYRNIYQTLEDKNNVDYIEANGPFKCERNDACLGSGYYFWENHIENAHWWGEKSCDNNYIICKSGYFFDHSTCYDLVDYYQHTREFSEIAKKLKSDGNFPKITVPRIIAYMKEINIFHYNAVRMEGEQIKSHSSEYSHTIPFLNNNNHFLLETIKPTQICFYDKIKANLDSIRIIYPECYSSEYCV